jgi:hypothetical protein
MVQQAVDAVVAPLPGSTRRRCAASKDLGGTSWRALISFVLRYPMSRPAASVDLSRSIGSKKKSVSLVAMVDTLRRTRDRRSTTSAPQGANSTPPTPG